MADEKVAQISPVKNKNASLRPFHFDDEGGIKQGPICQKRPEPYARFELSELRGVPVSAATVWVLLLRQWHITKSSWVTVPKWILKSAGLDRYQLRRGLVVLEEAGLVELLKKTGNSTKARRK